MDNSLKIMWIYQGSELQNDQVPEKAIGFIYLITQISTGKRYIGRKMLSAASTKTVNGKKRKIRKESNWKDYWSSSPQIQQWIKDAGTADDFTREILVFCHSRGSLAYCEELALYQMGTLESDNWINQNIRSKIKRNWVKLDDALNLRKVLERIQT